MGDFQELQATILILFLKRVITLTENFVIDKKILTHFESIV